MSAVRGSVVRVGPLYTTANAGSIYEQASAASRRAANLDEASLAELETRVYAGPQEFELVLREDLNAELAALTAAPSVLPYEDEYTLELDQSLRAEARVVHHRRMRRQLDAGPDVYVTHARSSLEARKARQASAAPGTGSRGALAGAPEIIQAAQEAAVWVGLAIGSGVVGAAPYDLLKHLISGYRQRGAISGSRTRPGCQNANGLGTAIQARRSSLTRPRRLRTLQSVLRSGTQQSSLLTSCSCASALSSVSRIDQPHPVAKGATMPAGHSSWALASGSSVSGCHEATRLR